MEYIRILGSNFGSSLRSLNLPQENWLKIAGVVVVVVAVAMIFWGRRK